MTVGGFVRLIALMLLPVLGMATVSILQVREQLSMAQAAGRAEARVRTAGALDVARAAFEQEVGPDYVATVARDPSLLTAQAFSSASVAQQAKQVIDEVPALRAATDVAIVALRSNSSVAASVPRLRRELSKARQEIDTGSKPANGQSQRDLLVTDMTRLENAEITAATARRSAPGRSGRTVGPRPRGERRGKRC